MGAVPGLDQAPVPAGCLLPTQPGGKHDCNAFLAHSLSSACLVSRVWVCVSGAVGAGGAWCCGTWAEGPDARTVPAPWGRGDGLAAGANPMIPLKPEAAGFWGIDPHYGAPTHL